MEQPKLIIFNDVKSLYEDMVKHNQSFTKSENEYNDKKAILEGCTIYRHVELHKSRLRFYGNMLGGNELHILGKILYAEKIDVIDNGICEYKISIEDRVEPVVFQAVPKRL